MIERYESMMRRILAALCLTALLLTSAALAENVTVVCSFYPLRVFAENVLRDVPDVSLQTLAPAGTGCLHDFQLLPGDLRALEGAKCLIINGAGMEDQFLPLLKKELSALPLVDCSAGITLIEEDEGPNPHIWLNALNARQMVLNMGGQLAALLPGHADRITANAAAYADRLLALHEELTAQLSGLPSRDIVTFHEAYPYFADEFGLNLVASVTVEPDEAPSPRMIAETVEKVRQYALCPLFSEPGVASDALQVIARETNQPVYELSPITDGDGAADDYEKGMRRNAETLAEALSGTR